MFQIFIGIALFFIGLICVETANGWIGAIILGPILIIQGYKSRRNNQKHKGIQQFFSVHKQELLNRLMTRESIDEVANHLFTNHAVPVSLTYNFYGNFLLEKLDSTDKSDKDDAYRILKIQKQDFAADISNNIKYFSTDSTIIKYDDSSHMYNNDKKLDGLLLLSKSHILFFPENKGLVKKLLQNGWEKIWDKLYESPLFFIPLFVDLIFVVKNETQKPLSKSKLKSLKNCFDKGKCNQIAIIDIDKVETIKKKALFFSNSCILITTNNGNQMCLGTKETNAKDWVSDISKQIKFIALAEGKDLFSLKSEV